MNLSAQILTWAAGRPEWQRDLLRRLAEGRRLSDIDQAEVLELLKRETGMLPDGELSAAPLAAEHLPEGGVAEERLVLRSISEVANVNRLKPGARLDLNARHLTLVYGGNGTGKSGFVRIWKRACRTRKAQDVLANVFADTRPTAPPGATITYALVHADGTEQEVSATWEEGHALDGPLSRARVFDSRIAHLDERRKLRERPTAG
jgi:hypothetical protein